MFRASFIKALDELKKEGFLPETTDLRDVVLEPAKDSTHGDLATNAALVLAKETKLRPLEIAQHLQKTLQRLPDIESIKVAGPGFVNITLRPTYWIHALQDLLTKGEAYGNSQMGAGIPLNIEYVSANPTGPLHAGHGRVAVVADVIANLLKKVGFDVTREYYINDTGGQIDVLARSTYLRYREALGETITHIPEGYYPGEYLKEVAAALVAAEGDQWLTRPEAQTLPFFGRFATDSLMKEIRKDLETIGICQDVFTSELKLHQEGAIIEALSHLQKQDLIYEGILDKPKIEKEDGEWAPQPLLLFKSSHFGDTSDRPLKKTTGEWTYLAGDIAYHQDKLKRGFSILIDVWGADHASHVDRMTAAVKALAPEIDFSVILAQMVHFVRDGEPLKMSKRAGSFVTVRDIVEQIGSDVFRFLMVSRKHDSQFTLDLNQALEQSKENPVFYVQYAHARACSVLRMGRTLFPEEELIPLALAQVNLALLRDEAEIFLLKALADWPRQIENAARAREPHRIVNFLYELAHRFHTLWNKGKKDTILRFLIPEQKEVSMARLALVQGLILVVASGLQLLGVRPMEEMR